MDRDPIPYKAFHHCTHRSSLPLWTGTELPQRPLSPPSPKPLSLHTQPACCLHTGVAASTHTASLHTSPLDTRPYTLCATCRHLPLCTRFCRLTLTSLLVDIPVCLHTDGDTLRHVHTHSHFYSTLPAICRLTLSTSDAHLRSASCACGCKCTFGVHQHSPTPPKGTSASVHPPHPFSPSL